MEDILTIAQAIADAASTVPGVTSAHAGHVNTLEYDTLPCVQVIPAGMEPGTLERSNMSGGTMWLVNYTVEIIGPRVGDTPEEWNTVNALITPLVDHFGAGRVQDRLPTLNGHVDRLEPVGFDPSMVITHAGSLYYAARIYLSCKFHRRTHS